MKRTLLPYLFAALAATQSHAADGLYYVGSESEESLPLEWQAGMNAIWDDNVTPNAPGASGDSAFSLNPFVGLSFINVTPQQTLDVYATVGALYYLDSLQAAGADDLFPQLRLGVNWTRRISERLRFVSRNFVAYEVEPNFAFGFATTRQINPYFFWQTDNAIGYRWTERFATYTGIQLGGLIFDDSVANQDRFIVTLYNQFRYQLTPQSVLTFDYRYGNNTGDQAAADSEDHFFLLGLEHRFSANTILVGRAGLQVREIGATGGDTNTAPYVELALRSQINDQFSLRGFTRYGMEVFDTVRAAPGTAFLYDFGQRQTLRVGIEGDYVISPKVSLFGGLDVVVGDFEDGRPTNGGGPVGTFNEDLWNAYMGLSVRMTEGVFATATYNYTDSNSDFDDFTFERNRVSVGVRAEF